MNKNKCNRCGECCKFLVFETPNTAENIQFMRARGCSILDPGNEYMLVRVDIPCPHLVHNIADNKYNCAVHNSSKMPEACRVFPQDGQEKILPFCAYNK